MGWRDRDYNRKEPHDSDDEFVDASYEPDESDEDYAAEEDDIDTTDPEAPDEADVGSDEPAFVRCPNCRKMIAEDSEQCPRCGHYVLDEELESKRPVWVWVGIAMAMAVALVWALAG